MKRSFLSILLAFVLLLSGCHLKPEAPTETGADTDTSPAESEADPSGEDTAYLDIECYQPNEFSEKLFAWENDRQVLSLDMPDEWELSQNSSGGIAITRNGKTIGAMVSGDPEGISEWEVLQITEESHSGMFIQKCIEKRGSGETLTFRCRFVFQYQADGEERTVTLTANYEEVADFTSRKLLVAPEVAELATDPGFGILSDVPKHDLLILGNSFIGSSEVGWILQEMLDNNRKDANVTPVSRGYATVDTYISYSSLMSEIRYGLYDIIFICGFYNTGEASNLEVLKEACDASGTTLVIFPAHNENATAISTARSRCPSLVCLDWKQEVDALIAQGVDRWDFCINDQHKHSTPLAGYVGAHMIYRALYGTVPQGSVYGSISQSEVNFLLGDYPMNPTIPLKDADDVFYLR